jgi:predicted RNase H-like nuclease (RuvC/YqgF family)
MMRETGPSALTAARRNDVNARRGRVTQALEAMQTEGIAITISSVAARARVHRSFIHRHLDLRADVYAAADRPSAAATATTTTRQSLEADNLNLRATVRRQTQHIADLEARLSELLGEQAYSRTGLGAPRNHAALEEQNHTLQNEIQELQAKLQDQEEELGAAREANRQLMGQLNKTTANEEASGRRGTIQHPPSPGENRP